MEIIPRKVNTTQGAKRKLISVQWVRNHLTLDSNTGTLYSDGNYSAERESQSLAVRGKKLV